MCAHRPTNPHAQYSRVALPGTKPAQKRLLGLTTMWSEHPHAAIWSNHTHLDVEKKLGLCLRDLRSEHKSWALKRLCVKWLLSADMVILKLASFSS